MMNPFLDPDNQNYEGGDLYFNFGEVSEDILKDGLKSYENGNPIDGSDQYMQETAWGRVSSQSSLTYAFDTATGARQNQDLGLDGLSNDAEYTHESYSNYLDKLRTRLSASTLEEMQNDAFSPLNDPAGDNYHFYRGYDFDEQRLNIHERYKHYNGTEGNSLSPDDADDALYQAARAVPDVEDINQDNTLNEYERYYQYKVSIRPEDLVVGHNYITDKQSTTVRTVDGKNQEVEWYQFKIPLSDYERVVGSINDFTTIRFVRMFMTGFKKETHLRFATLELVRGEWRTYDYNLNNRGDTPAEGQIDISVVNIEENASRKPVNYVLPPGVTRIVDPGQSQITQLNEQSMSMKVTNLAAGDARGVYRNTSQDLRNYKRLQMWVHAEQVIDDNTNLKSGDLSLFVRLGTDVKSNYYEYSIPLSLTPERSDYNNNSTTDRYAVWPEDNHLDFNLQSLVDLKTARNTAKREEQAGVSYNTLFTDRDPDNERNTIAVIGNPTLSDVRVILIGVRNNSATTKDGTVWVNELKVTDFDESGGWAAKANATLTLSDVATLNMGAHKETAGFGGVDQSLNNRRLDDYEQYNFAVQADLGKLVPEKVKLRAPIYYSYSKETTTPKYNPLDQDVLLKDALDACDTKEQRDSINSFAIERSVVQNFSLSGLNFGVQSKNPMPWDPANFTFNFSFNKQHKNDPTTEYENTNDYRGSFQYTYTPYIKGLKPFSKLVKGKNKNLTFIKDWEIQWLPNNISFLTNMSRYYYEQQTRSEVDDNFQLPVSVSKNFLWDRQLSITWNILKSLTLSFNSNTSARIEEPTGAVNKKLFPDEYREWKETVWNSIKSMGTPWNYNQTFSAAYKAPFSRIPVLDFLSASANYNATYKWDRGATIDDVEQGNTIANQAATSADVRLNFDGLWNKIPFVKDVNKRFASQSRAQAKRDSKTKKPKKFERTFKLLPDTTLTIKHNLRTQKVKVVAVTTKGTPIAVETKVVDANTIMVLTKGDENVKFTITENLKDEKSLMRNIGEYTTRLVISPRSLSMRYKRTNSMSLPLFTPSIGNVFGQSNSYGPMSPGLDFAFGFNGDDYVDKALNNGWLITDDGQTSPAVISHATEFNLELQLEPFKGFKITLTGNRTDNRTQQVQFMYDGMPTTYSGSYTKTHCAIATALRGSSADNNYYSETFNKFLQNIDIVRDRIEQQYLHTYYPTNGFMEGTAYAGTRFNSEVGGVSETSSDVLIPAFVAAYTGTDARKTWLNPFPSIASILPNWKVTYDGLLQLGNMRRWFKSFTLSHAYQCTYSVGSYSSYLNWVAVGGDNMGFTLDELTGNPVPSSPYNISSVAITEKFAPLVGVNVTLQNELQLSAEYRDQRTLTLNSSAAQIVEATTKGIKLGAGYKIVGFNTFLKIKGTQQGVSNDLTLNANVSLDNTKSLIRRISSDAYTQPTSGTRSFNINFTANYVLSKKVTLSAYFDHQASTPLVTTSSYPTTNTSYGISVNLSLAR
jgi:cell surface protein SprA